MCNLNNPLICSLCAFEITKQHLSPGNLGNCLKLYVLENKCLVEIFQYISSNLELFQQNKKYNTFFSPRLVSNFLSISLTNSSFSESIALCK